MTNSVIIRCEKEFKIINSDKSKYDIIDYNVDRLKYHNILYKTDAQKFFEVKDNVDYIDLGILEGYAKDKNDKNLNR